MPEMNRDEMIAWLVRNDMDHIMSGDKGRDYLVEILWKGFDGYAKQTDQQLTVEIHERDPDAFSRVGA